MRVLSWQRERLSEAYIRSGQSTFMNEQWSSAHKHDFYEWFWVDSGQICHELNKHGYMLQTGDCMFMDTTCQHRLKGTGCITTVSIPKSVYSHAFQRWGRDNVWPWNNIQIVYHFDQQARTALHRSLSHIDFVKQSVIDADFFVAQSLRLLSHVQQRSNVNQDWLQSAIDTFKQRQLYASGLAAFQNLCPVSNAHLSRTVRKQFNCRTTDLVNKLRLDHVAHELRFTNKNILRIALECGFNNQGHFHKLFKQRFRQTPLQFRKFVFN